MKFKPLEQDRAFVNYHLKIGHHLFPPLLAALSVSVQSDGTSQTIKDINMRILFIQLIVLFFSIFAFDSVIAQQGIPQHIGTCNIPTAMGLDQIYLYNNYTYTSHSAAFHRPLRRDPTGFNYIQLSSNNPNLRYFVSWNAQVVEYTPFGWRIIGHCNYFFNMPSNPNYARDFQNLNYSNAHVRGLSNQYIPERFVNHQQPNSAPLLTTEQDTLICAKRATLRSGNLNKKKFGDCMVNEMLGEDERKLYHCGKSANGDKTKFALCSMSSLGGKNEQLAAEQVSKCYAKHKDNYDQYPLCMASQNMNEDTAILLSCVRRQSEQGEVTFYSTVVCYGVSKIDLNLTPEQQIALECAVASGGEPYSFAACAGGQLTARELDKCFTHGIGGKGCFGPNNDIIKALRGIGINLHEEFGPNNTLVKTWNNAVNDFRHGPGKNNEARKLLTNAVNDITKGPGKNNEIRKFVNTLPGIKW